MPRPRIVSDEALLQPNSLLGEVLEAEVDIINPRKPTSTLILTLNMQKIVVPLERFQDLGILPSITLINGQHSRKPNVPRLTVSLG